MYIRVDLLDNLNHSNTNIVVMKHLLVLCLWCCLCRCDASPSAMGAMGCEGHPAEGACISGRAVLQGG